MNHPEVRQKYSAARRIFNFLLGVSSGDETLRLMFDILHETLRLMPDILLKNRIASLQTTSFLLWTRPFYLLLRSDSFIFIRHRNSHFNQVGL